MPTPTFLLSLPTLDPHTQRLIRVINNGSLHVPRVLSASGMAEYESETTSCFLAALEFGPPGEVFDIGANVGLFSWLVATDGTRKVRAFEPTPDVADVLSEVMRLNSLNIQLEQLAFGRENGNASFYLSSRSDCSNSLQAGYRVASNVITVPVETVDSYCLRTGACPSILKIDTETTEPDVLRGALETIQRRRPWLFVEVLNDDLAAVIDDIMRPFGYSYYYIDDDLPPKRHEVIRGGDADHHRNWLFAPEAPPTAYWDRVFEWRAAIRRCGSTARVPLDASNLAFSEDGTEASFWARWQPTSWPAFTANLVSPQRIRCESTLPEQRHVHFFHGQRPFEQPELPQHSLAIDGSRTYEITLTCNESAQAAGAAPSSMPAVHLLAFRYGAGTLIGQTRHYLRPGENRLRFTSELGATSLRIAFRVSGPGAFELTSVAVSVLD